MILLQGQNKSNEFYKMIMYIEKYPWMPIDDDRGRPRSVPDRPIRPSPSRLKMTAPFPSYPRTDGVWPSRPVLSNFGRTGRLRTLHIDHSTIYHLCVHHLFVSTTCSCQLLVHVDYSFVSTASPRVNYSLYQQPLEMQCAIENIYDVYGLWTADTRAMSADTQVCDSGQWTPRDRLWQFGHVSTKSRVHMVRIGSSIVSCTLRTFDPPNG